VRTLIGQQVSVRAAQSLTARIVDRCGTLQPARLADANLERIGMPGRRVAAIQNFAKLANTSAIDLTAAWAELGPALAELPGFGPWTCAYLGIRIGRDPDAFPVADVGLMRAAGAESPKALARMAEAWRPLRAFAATYLWFDPPARALSTDKLSGD
jgi:3-methyladenine DNA glycosylase/8-oxoguanine DNA glycosylase